jgi:hypothetical protein
MHHLLLPEYGRPIAVTALAAQARRNTLRIVDSLLSNDQRAITQSSSLSNRNNRPSLVRQLRDDLKSERDSLTAGSKEQPDQAGSSPVSVFQCPTPLLAEADISMLAISNDDSDQLPIHKVDHSQHRRTKRVTFAAELNLRRRSARQSLLGLTVAEIDALPCDSKRPTKPRELVSILRKKELTTDQILVEVAKVKRELVEETSASQVNEQLLIELEESNAVLLLRLQQSPSPPPPSSSQIVGTSLDEVEKRGRKYTRKICNLRRATELTRLESRKLKSQLVNVFAPLKKVA